MQTPKPVLAPKRTVEQILDGFIKKTGGPAYGRITSSLSRGTLSATGGTKGTFEIKLKTPDKFLMRLIVDRGEIAIGYDGKEGWMRDPDSGLRLLQGAELAQLRLQALQTNSPQSWRSYFGKVELLGLSRIEGAVCYKVRLFPKNGGEPLVQYYETSTLLLLRSDQAQETPQGKQPTQTYPSDYRAVDGVKTAFKMRQVVPGTEMTFQLTSVQNNIPLVASDFARPKEEPNKPAKIR